MRTQAWRDLVWLLMVSTGFGLLVTDILGDDE